MKFIRTEILIQASAKIIWHILTDFNKYPEWNPFVKKIQGEKKSGSQIQVCIQPPGKKAMAFKPTIQTYEPANELQWLGHLWMPGLFDGKHSFKLIPLQQGGTLFIHSEQFSGLLVPLLWGSLQAPTVQGFELMNQTLKQRAETAAKVKA